jgi:nucleobindin
MKINYSLLIVALISTSNIVCPPVVPDQKPGAVEAPSNLENDPLINLEYHKYLKEVVNILEADPQFKNMIENASVEDIKSGQIATHLDLVNHNVRTKLDELKRQEIDRLNKLINRKIKLNQVNREEMNKLVPLHLDHSNTDTFEKHDLEKLIRQATVDLEQIDKKRRDEFKDHELEKELERRKELEKMDEEHRKQAELNHQIELEKRKHHEKVNHPGSQDQLEEVWEKQDDLEEEKFDPTTFFKLHDTNGDGFLNEFEIEALFQIELDKIYNISDPNYDPLEREEEMNRMREHVMNEIDKDKDRMISFKEFTDATQQQDFKKNEEWKTVEDEPQFNQQEFEAYSRAHVERANHIPSPPTPPQPKTLSNH